MRQPDADTNGRNLRPVLTPTQGLPSEMVRDLASGPASGTDQADAGAAGGGRLRQPQAAQDEEPLVPSSSAARRPEGIQARALRGARAAHVRLDLGIVRAN
ncbi:hypothetical protein ACWD4T_44415, partial [Streptomyces umbrinus]